MTLSIVPPMKGTLLRQGVIMEIFNQENQATHPPAAATQDAHPTRNLQLLTRNP
ncbi:MAG TPA: hypothetical protein VE242_00440 [Chthoniobacterales bacterium]|nr:hypothetical protein [Chthoniobacterales bacterium]